ncbi:serine/threonine-protein kinase HipA [Arcicella aurantiaca]|uniref:Serine/threonine-protein kinase HipA n=1 Tax=Arcicella aurantiaca TaxID=591202 RepID=A0A316DHZ6_9BACT|nr:HipA domain-containing protein [Arcicella aurantiaca]PWK17306.1 serine/threonine-protein kinase HipA [Arcicella aurantiaca]
MIDLKYCPGTLAEGYSSYSSTCLRKVFRNKKVSHVLPYPKPQTSEEIEDLFMENRKRISISGVQEKLSLILEKNQLRLTKEGEQGEYILKPIPRDLKKIDQVPANEHLTMQIASQVFGINTAANALIFFADGTPAYITKRFDIKEEGIKWGVEDFASLAGKTKDNFGVNYKYEFSYEELGELIQFFVPTWRIEMEKYFILLIFNYLFSNGDAHLKNFSLIETPKGDYVLSPAYDLINTRLHVDDTDFALSKGLFKDDFRSIHQVNSGHAHQDDFMELGKRLGMNEARIKKLLLPFLDKQPLVETLISHSFLTDANKRAYSQMISSKRNFLKK